MSVTPPQVLRQSLSLPGGSCDLRVGSEALDLLGNTLRGIVGHPREAALACGPEVAPELAEDVRRSLTDAGFKVMPLELPGRDCLASVACVPGLCEGLAAQGITADDAIVAVGDITTLSAVALVAGLWCGGTSLVEVPTTLSAAASCGATSQDLAVGDQGGMVAPSAHPRLVVADLDRMELKAGEEPLLARALFAAAAMCDSANALSLLDQAVSDILAADTFALRKQVVACERERAFMLNSTSVATRQGIAYGTELARALRSLPALSSAPLSQLMAEGMRFSARISCGMGSCDIALVQDQDALLSRLGLDEVSCEVDADELLRALKASAFLRHNRFTIACPQAVGRVRLMTPDDDLLHEHLGAWCATRAHKDS